MQYHLVYKITNIINDKVYIGKHSTYRLDDGYMGSGDKLREAYSKYGYSNFRKEVIFCAFTETDAYLFEASLVNEDFLKRRDVYNVCLGGQGFPSGEQHPFVKDPKKNPMYGKKGKLCPNFGQKRSLETIEKFKIVNSGDRHPFYGKKHTEEAKRKISEGVSGKLNGMYGRTHSEDSKKKIGEGKGFLGKTHKLGTCPHCGKECGVNVLKRWHLDNCKLKLNL